MALPTDDYPHPRTSSSEDEQMQMAAFKILKDAPKGVLHAITKMLDKTRQRALKNKEPRETLMWGYNRRKNPSGTITGDKNNVRIDTPNGYNDLLQGNMDWRTGISPWNTSKYTLHNHPSGSTFSDADLGTFKHIDRRDSSWDNYIVETDSRRNTSLDSTERDLINTMESFKPNEYTDMAPLDELNYRMDPEFREILDLHQDPYGNMTIQNQKFDQRNFRRSILANQADAGYFDYGMNENHPDMEEVEEIRNILSQFGIGQ